MTESTRGSLWPDRGGDPDPIGDLQRAMELVETHGNRTEPDPVSPGMFRRLRSWFSSRLQAFDESHVVDLGDVDDAPDVPEMVCVIDDAGPHPDVEVPPIQYELGDSSMPSLSEWRERFRSSRLIWLPQPVEVSCAFCHEKATEEIFLGWEFTDSRSPGPLERVVYGLAADDQVTGVEARFARVCKRHVGHSRFTRSDRPVDEL